MYESLENKYALSVKNLSASYDNNIILNDISIEIWPGEFVCLCGPNGCGKSTLLSILSGVQNKNLKISPKQLKINSMSKKQAAKYVAFMQQNEHSIWNFSVEELVLQGRFCHTKNGFYTDTDKKIALQSLELLQIEHLAKRKIHTLSGGEFQKVRIARCLCQKPKFILLDEPASNLDFTYEPWLMKKLKEIAHSQNIGILITIHDINIASRFADSLIMLPLRQPPIYGKIKDVLTTDNLKKTYGVEFSCQKIDYFQSLL